MLKMLCPMGYHKSDVSYLGLFGSCMSLLKDAL